MQISTKRNVDMSFTDTKAAIAGAIFSILGINLIGVASDALLALVLGCIGAVGGWLMNKLLRWIDRRFTK